MLKTSESHWPAWFFKIVQTPFCNFCKCITFLIAHILLKSVWLLKTADKSNLPYEPLIILILNSFLDTVAMQDIKYLTKRSFEWANFLHSMLIYDSKNHLDRFNLFKSTPAEHEIRVTMWSPNPFWIRNWFFMPRWFHKTFSKYFSLEKWFKKWQFFLILCNENMLMEKGRWFKKVPKHA